jgi:hypothetical protein
MELFEKATKHKVRFESDRGLLSVEDLWDLPLTDAPVNLDAMAMGIQRRLNVDTVESFVMPARKQVSSDQFKLDILKHIINSKIADAERAMKARATKERNQRIMGIIAAKEDEKLQEHDISTLRNMLADSESD